MFNDIYSINYVPALYKKYIGDECNSVLDIGSRDGDDANFLSNALKAKNVYTFECHPEGYKNIKLKYPKFNNINVAVSNYIGESSFNAVYSNHLESGVSSLKDRNDDWYKARDTRKVNVNVSRMDKIIEEYSIETPIDLIKIDVEGLSYEVLDGFGEYIKSCKFFHIETETVEIWENQKTTLDVLILMTKKGFVLVDEKKFGPTSCDQVWVNKRFIRNENV